MPGITWLPRLLTAILLIVVIGNAWINRSPQTPINPLKRTYQVSHNTWRYMTEQNSGGATVPVAYRYALSRKIRGDEREIARRLRSETPIIAGSGTSTDIQMDDKNVISVTYSGNVLSFSDDATQVSVKILQH